MEFITKLVVLAFGLVGDHLSSKLVAPESFTENQAEFYGALILFGLVGGAVALIVAFVFMWVIMADNGGWKNTYREYPFDIGGATLFLSLFAFTWVSFTVFVATLVTGMLITAMSISCCRKQKN